MSGPATPKPPGTPLWLMLTTSADTRGRGTCTCTGTDSEYVGERTHSAPTDGEYDWDLLVAEVAPMDDGTSGAPLLGSPAARTAAAAAAAASSAYLAGADRFDDPQPEVVGGLLSGDGVCREPVVLEPPSIPPRRSRIRPRGEKLVSTRRQVAVICVLLLLLALLIVARAWELSPD